MDPRKIYRGCVKFLVVNWMAFAMLSAIILGFILGIILRKHESYSNREIMYIGFLGELFLQMLKGIAVPLMVSCIITAFATMNAELAKIFGIQLTIFILATKVIGVLLGLTFVLTIKPGVSDKKEELEIVQSDLPIIKRETVDTFLDIMKNIFPTNIVDMAIRQSITNITEDVHGNRKIYDVMIDGVNMLGLVTISILSGVTLKALGVVSKPLVDVILVFGEITFVIVDFIMKAAPILLISLVAQQIVIVDPEVFLSTIGLFVVTTICALLTHFFIVFPLIVFFIARKNPFKLYWNCFEAITTAFASGSSMGTLPICMDVLEEKCGYDSHLTSFIVPIAVAINKDGACINLTVASIFFAQYDNMHLSASQILLVCIFAITTSLAAPGVPQGVLLMLIIILESLGLPGKYAGSIIAVDLLVDRCVTVIGIVGAAVAVAVIDQLTKKTREKMAERIA